MKYNYRPLGDRVVIEMIKRSDEKTKGGLHRPAAAETVSYAKVVAIGPGLFTQTGDRIPMSVNIGDTVLLQGTGTIHKNGDTKYQLLRESEILTIIDEK